MNIEDVIKKAKEIGSYFVTVTIKNEKMSENDLTHFAFREKFSLDDVIPSLDSCVRSMRIEPEKPVDVIIPSRIHEERKPLKIAIFSHGSTMPDCWSIGKAIRNQIKILVRHGHQVVYYTQEKSKLTNEELGCEVRHLVPSFRREKGIINEVEKKRMIDMLREQLTSDFNLAISHDFFLQDTITYRQAIVECGVKIPWLHFCRSGVAEYINFDMPNARYVYLNKTDAGSFAKHIGVDISKIRFIPNEKEPSYLMRWDPLTLKIINKFQLWDRDIIMIYPACSTRLQAKGLNDVIKVFVELKRLGKKVFLLVANSNGRKRRDDLSRECQLAEELGLSQNEFAFSSLLDNEFNNDQCNITSELPNKVIVELFIMSNLFIMASRAEVCSNVLLEACMTKNLIVVNSDLPSLYDFVDKENVLSYPFTSSKSLHYSGKESGDLNKLAKQIIGQLESSKTDKTFRQVWKNHNAYSLYHGYLEPVIYENSI